MFKSVDSYLKSAVKGSSLVFAGTVLSILLWFATKILIINNTTKEELGIYSLAVAIISIFALVAGAGLQDGSTRYISLFSSAGREKDASAVAKASIQISMISGTVASLGIFLTADLISRRVFYMPELIGPLKAISLFALFHVLSGTLVGVIRGYGNIRARVYYISIGQPLFFLILLAASFKLALPFISVVYSFMIAMLITCFGIATYGYRKTGLNILSLSGGGHRIELLKFSLPLLGTAAMGVILNWTDTLMLGRYTTAEEVGVYSVSVSLARLLMFAFGAASFVFVPIAGEMYAKKEMGELKRTFQILTKWIFSATLPIFFVLFFFPEMTISFLFSEQYIVSSDSLRVLSIGFLFSVFVGANTSVLIIMGQTKKLMNISIAGAVLNILLNYILIKRLGYGVMGAAVATTFSYVCISVMNGLLLYSKGGIHPITAKYLRPIASSAIIGLAIYAMAKNLPLHFWMIPLYLVLFVGGYIITLLLTRSLDREDIALFEAISKKTGLQMEFIRKLINKFAHS